VAANRRGEGGLKVVHVMGVDGRIGATGISVALKERPGGRVEAPHRVTTEDWFDVSWIRSHNKISDRVNIVPIV
jgi:hypothetical protein